MRVVSLGSGSSGNALLVQTSRTAVLVDAGFAAAHAGQPAAPGGRHAGHAQRDPAHPRAFGSRQRRGGLRGDARHPARLRSAHAEGGAGSAADAPGRAAPLPARRAARGQEHRFADLDVRSFAISHDAVAPCGYVLSTGAWTVTIATDTGECAPQVIEALRGAHLLVLEANHDRERLLAAPIPGTSSAASSATPATSPTRSAPRRWRRRWTTDPAGSGWRTSARPTTRPISPARRSATTSGRAGWGTPSCTSPRQGWDPTGRAARSSAARPRRMLRASSAPRAYRAASRAPTQH